MQKSTLLDIILTNYPHKYNATGFFCNDVSDHSAIVCVRNTKPPKVTPRFIFKRYFKKFNEQAFLHDLYRSDIKKVSLMPDVNVAWDYFLTTFMPICDKHAPLKKYRIRGRDNPWFSESISNSLRLRDTAWAKARTSNAPAGWTSFRVLRNKCARLIRTSKSEFYLKSVTQNLNNPTKFWKLVKSVSGANGCAGLLDHLKTEGGKIKDKNNIIRIFNEHFISAGSVFNHSDAEPYTSVGSSLVTPGVSSVMNLFHLKPVTATEVCEALKGINCKMSAGPDNLGPYLLKTASDFIAEPIVAIF